MKIRFSISILLAVTFLITACAQSSSKEQASSQANTEKPLLKDIDGKELQEIIESYKGDKAVLVNVWATWCVPCVEEFPEIIDIQRKYPDQLQVVFVSADFPENRDRAVEFLKKHNVDWTTYFKTGKDEAFINAISKDWSGALPFSKIIHTNGNVIAHWEKKADFDTFDKHVKQAIKP
jgi:thiol-disulfide isomerase/thioredoxin